MAQAWCKIRLVNGTERFDTIWDTEEKRKRKESENEASLLSFSLGNDWIDMAQLQTHENKHGNENIQHFLSAP